MKYIVRLLTLLNIFCASSSFITPTHKIVLKLRTSRSMQFIPHNAPLLMTKNKKDMFNDFTSGKNHTKANDEVRKIQSFWNKGIVLSELDLLLCRIYFIALIWYYWLLNLFNYYRHYK